MARAPDVRALLVGAPLKDAVPRAGRRVSIHELAELLREAHADAQESVARAEARRERVALRRRGGGAVVMEDLARDMRDLLARVPACAPVALRELARDRADLVGLLVAALHAHRAGTIVLSQDEFPGGRVIVSRGQ